MQLTAGSLSSRAALRPCGGMRLRPRAVEPSARLGHAAAAAAADVDADGEAEAPGQRKRRLVLLRHADAVPRGAPEDDKERKLSQRGRKEAAWLASALQRKSARWQPDLILASDSERTRETLSIMAKNAPRLRSTRTVFVPALYDACADGEQTLRTLLDALSVSARDADATCLCIGHNPGFEQAAAILAATSDAGAALVVPMATGEAAFLKAGARDWEGVLSGDARWEACGRVSPHARAPVFGAAAAGADTKAKAKKEKKAKPEPEAAEAAAAASLADEEAAAAAKQAAKAAAKAEKEAWKAAWAEAVALAAAAPPPPKEKAGGKKKDKAAAAAVAVAPTAEADAAADAAPLPAPKAPKKKAAALKAPVSDDAPVVVSELPLPSKASKKAAALALAQAAAVEEEQAAEAEAALPRAGKSRRKAAEAAASAAWALAQAQTTAR